MDTDLKIKSSCCQPPYDLVEAEGGGHSQNARNNIVGLTDGLGGHRNPLKVMLSPEITAESDENELTTLNNQENFSENDEQIKNHVHKSDVEEPDQESEKNNLHSKLVAV